MVLSILGIAIVLAGAFAVCCGEFCCANESSFQWNFVNFKVNGDRFEIVPVLIQLLISNFLFLESNRIAANGQSNRWKFTHRWQNDESEVYELIVSRYCSLILFDFYAFENDGWIYWGFTLSFTQRKYEMADTNLSLIKWSFIKFSCCTLCAFDGVQRHDRLRWIRYVASEVHCDRDATSIEWSAYSDLWLVRHRNMLAVEIPRWGKTHFGNLGHSSMGFKWKTANWTIHRTFTHDSLCHTVWVH